MSSKSLGTLSLDLIVQTGGFESGMDKAARTADRKTRQMEREAKARSQAIEAAFVKMAAGIAAAWGALNLVGSVKQVSDLADQFSKLSQRTGVAVKDLSALGYAAKLNDASLQDLGNGLKGLSNKMLAAQSGSAEAGAAFKALGISVSDSTGKLRPTEQVLFDIAEAFSKMEDGAGKSALANKLMEESGIRLIPTLNNGRAGLEALRLESERFSQTMQDLAPFSVEFNDNLTRLNTQGQTLAATIALSTVPALNEIAKELLQTSRDANTFDLAAAAARTTIETLAVVGANVAFVFSGVGREIGGVAAQLAALGSMDFKAFSAIGNAMKEDAEEARKRLDAFEQRVFNPKITAAPAAVPRAPAPRLTPTPTLRALKTPRASAGKIELDPMADAARAYADTLQALARAQQQTDTAGLSLSATQQRLLEVMSDPTFVQMPEAWRQTIATQGEFTLQAEKAATEQAKLNALIAATPTAQLEAQRGTMQFLAEAFEQGRISAEQFSEAAATALGNVPKAAQEAQDALNEFAKNFAGAAQASLSDLLFKGATEGFDGLVDGFARTIQRMMADAAAAKLMENLFGASFGTTGTVDAASWIGTAMKWLASADGNAFNGYGAAKAFAAGGAFGKGEILTKPTAFRFADGGAFRNGIAGEAGPEGALPLKRMMDGRLGVHAEGANKAPTIIQNIHVNGDRAPDLRRATGQGAREGLAFMANARRYA